MNEADSARNLDDHHPKHALHPHQQISFSMPHNIHTQTRPNAAPNDNLPPFSKPLLAGGYFPPVVAGIPYNPQPAGVRQPPTLDLGGLTLSFPAAATLRELELGTVVAIDEEVYSSAAASALVGKAEGVYVAASSGDGGSHMMAMTARFVGSGEYEDGLRLFGVLKNDAEESHLAVIGGTGRYDGANGYATVKPLDISGSTSSEGGDDGSYKILNFNAILREKAEG
ncbi:dirigent protein 25-like [Ipomoea triloba]|uniref:dirigent protein 25-like n=1 Tax=Ipomoea triloba TaxID=35885 RepID=UPI00125CFA69|nr:dirigent protein 25-like [Ipomoea triloba]